jgi:methyl-accepting chemotaxis protein
VSEPGAGGRDDQQAKEASQPNGGLLADLGGGLSGALRPLAGLSGMTEDIREMLDHVKRMAGNTDALPDVTETLHAIRERTEHMDKEVTEMHAAVEELRALLEPVAGQLESVTRLTNRLPGGRKYRRAQAEADAAAAAEEAALDAETARVHDAE